MTMEMFSSPLMKQKTGECRMCGRKMDTTYGNIGASCLRKLNRLIKIHSRKNHKFIQSTMFDLAGDESNEQSKKSTNQPTN